MTRVVHGGALCGVCAVALAIASGSAADGFRCYFKVFGPQTRPDNTLVSKASYRCVRDYPGSRARVAVQRRLSGRWMTVGQTRKTIDIAAGKHYTIVASVPCQASTNFTGVKIRTYFTLKGKTFRFVLPSLADPALCTFNSTT